MFVFGLWQMTSAYKILFVIPSTKISRYKFSSELAKALAAEGHQVTVISPFKESKPIPNYEEVFLKSADENVEKCVFPNDEFHLSSFF